MNALALQVRPRKIPRDHAAWQTAIAMAQVAEPVRAPSGSAASGEGPLSSSSQRVSACVFLDRYVCGPTKAWRSAPTRSSRGTKVDGVYTPTRYVDPTCQPVSTNCSTNDMLREGYEVMDATGRLALARESLPIIVFDLRQEGNIRRVVTGEAHRNACARRRVNERRSSLKRGREDGEGGRPLKEDLAASGRGRASASVQPHHRRVLRYAGATPISWRRNQRSGTASLVVQPFDQDIARAHREGHPDQ